MVRGKRWALAEAGAIAVVFMARASGVLPLPAWPFLLLIAAAAGVVPWRDPAKRTRTRAGSSVRMIVTAACVGVAYQFFTIFLEGPFLAWLMGEPETPPPVDGLVGNLAGLLGFLVLVTVFAVGEELAFRGYLLERLCEWTGGSWVSNAFALVLSSVVFGAMHTWQNLPGVLGTVISGFVFGAMYLWSGRDVRAPIVTHLAVNVTAVVLAFFGLFIS